MTPEGSGGHGARVPRGSEAPDVPAADRGRFGRMFPQLPAGELGTAAIEALVKSMRHSSADNPDIPAGYTYLGQFIDHDITFDPTSQLQKLNDPLALVNFRTPRLDLDSIYGSGPADQPFLYEWTDPRDRGVKLLDVFDDLPRNAQGRALIGDPRNDENLILAQLHLLFIRFHNRVVEHVRERDRLAGAELLGKAQQLVRWHYQWIVVHDFLRRIVGETDGGLACSSRPSAGSTGGGPSRSSRSSSPARRTGSATAWCAATTGSTANCRGPWGSWPWATTESSTTSAGSDRCRPS